MKKQPSPSAANRPPVWQIRRESEGGRDQFLVYLDNRKIGAERSAADLAELLAGARLPADLADRVIAKLSTRGVVFVEVHPHESSACRKPSPESRP